MYLCMSSSMYVAATVLQALIAYSDCIALQGACAHNLIEDALSK
jgi:hypothetical protein